jgi:hypothetical protein
MDEQISQQRLYRIFGFWTIRLYRRAKRMDVRWTPYWRAAIDRIARKQRPFEEARLLLHGPEEYKDIGEGKNSPYTLNKSP